MFPEDNTAQDTHAPDEEAEFLKQEAQPPEDEPQVANTASFAAIKEAGSIFRSLSGIPKLRELALFYTLLEKSGEVVLSRDIIEMKMDFGLLDTITAPLFPDLLRVLKELSTVVDLLVRSQFVQGSDRERYYAEMVYLLDKIQDEMSERVILPIERDYIKSYVIPKWKYMILDAIKNLAGQVALSVQVKSIEKRSTGTVLILTVINTGNAVAENVRLTLKLSTPLVQQIDNLPSQMDTIVEFSLPMAEVDQQKVELVCHFDDLGAKNKSIEFNIIITEPGEHGKFRKLHLNPYTVGRPLRLESDLFFGRTDVLDRILKNLKAQKHDTIYMLMGERRTGKTSILYRLRRQLVQAGLFPVLIDLQEMVVPGDENFLFDIAQTIVFELQKTGYNLQPVRSDDFKESPIAYFEKKFLPQISQVLGENRLVLLVDEIAMLEKRVNDHSSTNAIFSYLRSLMSHNDVRFVLAGTIDYSVINKREWTELLNVTIKEKIEYLSQEETQQLATLPIQDYFVIEKLALDKLWEVTAGHPFFLQLVCRQLVDLANDNEITNIGVQHVRAVIPAVIDRGDTQLSDIWNNLSLESQRILAIIARLLRIKQIATPSDIEDRLKSLQIEMDWRKDLIELVAQGILLFDLGYYRFKVSLFGEWVANYRSVENLV